MLKVQTIIIDLDSNHFFMWMVGYDGRPAQIEVRYDAIDPVLLGKMESIGLSPVAVQDAIRNGEYNEFTTTYFLLKKKYEREQLVSSLYPIFMNRIVAVELD